MLRTSSRAIRGGIGRLSGGSIFPSGTNDGVVTLAAMTTWRYYQDRLTTELLHAMQGAIAHELKVEFEPPTGLTPELTVLLTKIERTDKRE
jgi:hypothetical protein